MVGACGRGVVGVCGPKSQCNGPRFLDVGMEKGDGNDAREVDAGIPDREDGGDDGVEGKGLAKPSVGVEGPKSPSPSPVRGFRGDDTRNSVNGKEGFGDARGVEAGTPANGTLCVSGDEDDREVSRLSMFYTVLNVQLYTADISIVDGENPRNCSYPVPLGQLGE